MLRKQNPRHEVVSPPVLGRPVDTDQPVQPSLAAKKEFTTNLIGWILQGGVILSSSVILIGLFMMSLQPDKFAPQKLESFPQTFSQVWTGLLALRPQAVITLGLLLLIATPVVRVAASIVTFAVEHDWRFVIITTLVLLLLLFSIFYVGAVMVVGQHQHFQHGAYSWIYPALIFLGAIAAGLLGSLVGLGGGVLIVPLLTLVFGFPIYFAIGASIISVIATSSGAAAAYVRDHMTNLRVGMFLELATTTGALCGAFLAGLLAPNILSIIFGIILLISAAPLVFKIGEELPQGVKNDRWADWLHLNGSYPDHHLHREVSYQVTRTPLGLAMMYLAGLISGLLGIGSGTFKVIALDETTGAIYPLR
jgi:uncharacterized membrane protein YfcA/uncharacterized membrane protein